MARSVQNLIGKNAKAGNPYGYGKSLIETVNEHGVRVYKKANLPFVPVEYKECEKHGKYVHVRSNGDPLQDLTQENCPRCEKEQLTRLRLGGMDGIAKRFQRSSFDNYRVVDKQQGLIKGALQEFAQNFEDHLEMGTPILLLGGVGTGKTHLASAVANQIAGDGFDTIFRSVSQIVRSVRDCWGKGAAESKLLELYRTVDLLIVDEVGIFSSGSRGDEKTMSDNEHKILFDIINGRYEDMKPTIMISNLKLDEFTKAVGQRISSRIQHEGKLLPFTWSDYRAA